MFYTLWFFAAALFVALKVVGVTFIAGVSWWYLLAPIAIVVILILTGGILEIIWHIAGSAMVSFARFIVKIAKASSKRY